MEAIAQNGKSYLLDNVNPQQLFNKYAGNGIIELGGRVNKANK